MIDVKNNTDNLFQGKDKSVPFHVISVYDMPIRAVYKPTNQPTI
jgi:hypothetical protein